MQQCLNVIAGLLGIVAAGLWFKSATVRVQKNEAPDESGWVAASISDENVAGAV